MIDQPTIDRILDAAQIVDVVSDFVTLRKRGVNYVGLCPFHDDKTPSFYVSPAKGLCKCFACGKGGNVVHFIMEHEQMSYPEALKYLAKKYGIEEGDWVLIENTYGSCKQKAHITPRIKEGVVSADHGWWFPERNRDETYFGTLESNINNCLSIKSGKIGLGNSYKSGLCRVSKVED